MNKSKQLLSHRAAKKNQKEVHKTLRLTPQKNAYEEELTARELLKKFPKKNLKKTVAKLGVQKKAPHKKCAKRTGPSRELITTEAPPAHSHREGVMWIKTLTKQGAMQRKAFNRSSTKKR